MSSETGTYDLFVIGGGINGAGIARDAAGRGLSVLLCEKDDLAQGTSSRSGKLVHGGLRYLEYYEFRLVREALIEREVLLESAPHIIWPMRFVLPHNPADRPAWLVRLGLFLYDHLGGRKRLPGTRVLNLRTAPEGAAIKPAYRKAFEYSDCWVDDARLVVLNALDAKKKGARILTRTACTSIRRRGDLWHVEMTDAETGAKTEAKARCVVNTAGPWVKRRDRPGCRTEFEPQRAPRQGQPHRRAEVLGGAASLSRPEPRQARDFHQSLSERSGADRHHGYSL
ncbi:glycerol-3-phosphate dehydrogenase [Sinorhizobium meliloti]